MRGLKKLRSQSGFSLFESILALLIVVILTTGITVGVNAAQTIYQRSVFYSECQVLAATLDTALSDVLRFSSDVVEEDGVVKFTNANYSVVKGHITRKDGWLYLNLSDEKADTEEDAPLTLLLNGGVYSSMELTQFTMHYADSVFSGSYEIVSKQNRNLKKSYDFYFRTLG